MIPWLGATQRPQLAMTGVPGFFRSSPAVVWALAVWFSWDPLLPYFTAVLLLALGLSVAIANAPPKANVLDKIILCGLVFIAMPMAVFGTEHYLHPARVGRTNTYLDSGPYFPGRFRGNVFDCGWS
jgi:hypothetical protein